MRGAAPGRHPAQSNLLVNPNGARARLQRVLHRAEPPDPGLGQGPAGPSRFLDQTRATCWRSSTRSCATSTRSCVPRPCTSARSRRCSRTTPRRPRPPTRSAGQGPLPAPHEPGEPGVARHLSAAPGLVPQQPVLQARQLRSAQGRPRRCSTAACAAERLPELVPSSPYLAEEFRNRIILYVLNSGNTVAPPCREQGPFTEAGSPTTTRT